MSKPNRIVWSSKLAYATGLMATDGSMSNDGRHIVFVSKDIEQIENFMSCLGVQCRISLKTSGFNHNKYPYIQFSNSKYYNWFEKIGIHPNKTKTISEIKIPDRYFFDFLRGHFDGDGSSYSYKDRRWKNSFMYYIQFVSASENHLCWIRDTLHKTLKINGKVRKVGNIYRLSFAKLNSYIIVNKMYSDKNCICLNRKKIKIFNAINAAVLELVDRHA